MLFHEIVVWPGPSPAGTGFGDALRLGAILVTKTTPSVISRLSKFDNRNCFIATQCDASGTLFVHQLFNKTNHAVGMARERIEN